MSKKLTMQPSTPKQDIDPINLSATNIFRQTILLNNNGRIEQVELEELAPSETKVIGYLQNIFYIELIHSELSDIIEKFSDFLHLEKLLLKDTLGDYQKQNLLQIQNEVRLHISRQILLHNSNDNYTTLPGQAQFLSEDLMRSMIFSLLKHNLIAFNTAESWLLQKEFSKTTSILKRQFFNYANSFTALIDNMVKQMNNGIKQKIIIDLLKKNDMKQKIAQVEDTHFFMTIKAKIGNNKYVRKIDIQIVSPSHKTNSRCYRVSYGNVVFVLKFSNKTLILEDFSDRFKIVVSILSKLYKQNLPFVATNYSNIFRLFYKPADNELLGYKNIGDFFIDFLKQNQEYDSILSIDGKYISVMPYTDKIMLDEYVKNTVLSDNDKLSIVSALLDVLVMLTSAGVVIRDLKPDNFSIYSREPFKLCLMDFEETALEITEEGYNDYQHGGTIFYATPLNFFSKKFLYKHFAPGDLNKKLPLLDWSAVIAIIFEVVAGKPLFSKTAYKFIDTVCRIFVLGNTIPTGAFLGQLYLYWTAAYKEFICQLDNTSLTEKLSLSLTEETKNTLTSMAVIQLLSPQALNEQLEIKSGLSLREIDAWISFYQEKLDKINKSLSIHKEFLADIWNESADKEELQSVYRDLYQVILKHEEEVEFLTGQTDWLRQLELWSKIEMIDKRDTITIKELLDFMFMVIYHKFSPPRWGKHALHIFPLLKSEDREEYYRIRSTLWPFLKFEK